MFVKKVVILGILNTILWIKRSIEHRYRNIVQRYWKFVCNTTHNSGDTLPTCRACSQNKFWYYKWWNTTLKNQSSMEHRCRSIMKGNINFVCDPTNLMCDTRPLCRTWAKKSVPSSNHWSQYYIKNVVLKQVYVALRQKKWNSSRYYVPKK